MVDHGRETRSSALGRFMQHAAQLMDAEHTRRSVMLAVSQYWNDSANDEVHGYVIASTRETPVWPHECDYGDDPEYRYTPTLAGEECSSCGTNQRRDIDMSFYGGYGDAMVGAFEVFCRESAHQGMEPREAYIPYAVVRRGPTGGLVLDLVSHAQRVPSVMIGATRGGAEWPDARARALFDEVCDHADDDGPRAVLSDYLLEAHPDDPRGEAIALALAADLDDDARARRDELFATHAERWYFPLGDVIVAGTAHVERGFLARADVYAATNRDRDFVLDAKAWGTVHTIRFAPESRDVVAPTMHALRDVGPLRNDGLAAIARAKHPWSIETLRVAGGDGDALLRAKTLPNLTTLELSHVFRDEVTRAFRRGRIAPWHAQLARLRFTASEYGSLADWRALRKALDVPEVSIAIAPYWTELASSWELGFRADDSVAVRSAGWHGDATMLRLAELLGELPVDTRIELVSTPARAMTDADVTWLREYTGRDVGMLPA
jgi:hypothetical protein